MFIENFKSRVIQNHWRFLSNYRNLRRILMSIQLSSFEETTKLLRNRDVINKTQIMITSLHKFLNLVMVKNKTLSNKIYSNDARIFLSAYLIKHFPKDIIGNVDENDSLTSNLISKSKMMINFFKILENPKKKSLMNVFLYSFFEYKRAFNKWKKGDVEKILKTLTHNYWELEVVVRNELEKEYTPETEDQREAIIQEVRRQQENILLHIQQIDSRNGMNYFNSYVPLFIERNVLQNVRDSMTQAFWDIFRDEMSGDNPNYTRVISLLEELKTLFYSCVPSRIDIHQEIYEGIDIELISQMIDNRVFDTESIKGVCIYIIDLIKRFQCEDMDNDLEDWRRNIIEYLDTGMPLHEFFTYFFRETFERMEIILINIAEERNNPLYQAYIQRLREIEEREEREETNLNS